jgi:hypothetical protein
MSVTISANPITRNADGGTVYDFLPGTEELEISLSSRTLVRVLAEIGETWDGETFGVLDVEEVRDRLETVVSPRGTDSESALLRQRLGELFFLVEAAHVRSAFGVIVWG